jgi:hypothetical protein
MLLEMAVASILAIAPTFQITERFHAFAATNAAFVANYRVDGNF